MNYSDEQLEDILRLADSNYNRVGRATIRGLVSDLREAIAHAKMLEQALVEASKRLHHYEVWTKTTIDV